MRFHVWAAWNEHRQLQRQQAGVISEMEVLSHRSLAMRYLHSWRVAEEFHRKRRRQQRLASALLVQTAKTLCRRSFVRWLSRVRRHRDRLKASALVPRLHHVAGLRLASTYFAKLRRHVVVKQQRRERALVDATLGDLAARCDKQDAQLDVSVRAMANANTVLSQLVDRVLVMEKKFGAATSPRYTDDA